MRRGFLEPEELDDGLARKLAASLQPEARKPVPEKHQGRRKKVLLTDEQVIDCRAFYEFDGWPVDRLAEVYGTSRVYMRDLLDYKTRSKLYPVK